MDGREDEPDVEPHEGTDESTGGNFNGPGVTMRASASKFDGYHEIAGDQSDQGAPAERGEDFGEDNFLAYFFEILRDFGEEGFLDEGKIEEESNPDDGGPDMDIFKEEINASWGLE